MIAATVAVRVEPAPSGIGWCTHTITRAGDAPTTLAVAAPGDTLCFSVGDLADADMMMTRSGTFDGVETAPHSRVGGAR